ncbi:MAG: hypothetical protein EAZ76_02495 [Nostocales cyanobacterium]|nr:MAG: hypothetical protein EAZ87_05205 [Nostocales cyanobacterium]TAF20004.1 MAG: hypothetical protein EAZ76_02495 [Nostocales cyanobacterium]
MIKYQAWPFLVSRNLYVDYRTIVAPDFICSAKIANLLAQAADGEIIPENTVYLRKILNSQVGNLTLVFRVFHPTKADIQQGDIKEKIKDGFGREICFIEGLVIREELEYINIVSANFEFIHHQVLPAYQEFWHINQPVPAVESIAFELENESDHNSFNIINLSPLILKKSLPTIQGKIIKVKDKDCQHQVSCIDFSADSKYLAIRTENQDLYLWDLAKDQYNKLYAPKHKDFMSEVSFNPLKNQYIAMGCYSHPRLNQPTPKNYVLLFDLSSNNYKELTYFWQQELGEKFSLKTVNFSPNGLYLASATQQGKLLIWQEQDNYEKAEVLNIHNGYPINCLIFTPDSKTVICGVNQDNQGYITLYTVPSHIQSLNYIHCLSLINKLAISPDGKYLAVAGNSGFELWDFATQNRLYSQVCDHPLTAINFNSTGEIIIWGDIQGKLTVFDIQRKIVISEYPDIHNDAITAIVFNPRISQQFATSGLDQKVKFWQLN